jgi:type IV pilus modification protein PilV
MKTKKLYYQAGVGIIEVMVAIILLAMTLLGAVALQFATAKEQRSSQFVSRAAIAANELAERMRANRTGLEDLFNPQYITSATTYSASVTALGSSSSTQSCLAASPCSSAAATAADDLAQWQQSLVQTMPRGQTAAIVLMPPTSTNGAALSRDIVIAWVEPVVDKDAAGNPILISSTAYGCPASIAAPAGVRCYRQRFVL